MGANPSMIQGKDLQADMHPVEYISARDAERFIDEFNKMTGTQCRLPTETEWEYAARNGDHYE